MSVRAIPAETVAHVLTLSMALSAGVRQIGRYGSKVYSFNDII